MKRIKSVTAHVGPIASLILHSNSWNWELLSSYRKWILIEQNVIQKKLLTNLQRKAQAQLLRNRAMQASVVR